MKQKKKPDYNRDSITAQYLDHAVEISKKHPSFRAAARELEIHPMKLRKILITAGEFENEMSREIQGLHKQGMSIENIAEVQAMSVSNVYSYLPYSNVIYKMDQKSVGAERQEKYREKRGERCAVSQELLSWLEEHPGIVADLERRAGLG